MCTPVGTPRLCKNGLFGRSYEAGWAGPSQAGPAKRSGYREAGVQPRGSSAVPGWQGGVWCCAKTLCPGGRAATQAGLFPCQLLTHPLPGPLSFLSVYRTCSNTAVLLPPPQLARIHSQTDGDSDLYHEAHLRHVFTGVGRTQVNYVWCESFNCRATLVCRHVSSAVVFSEFWTSWCRGPPKARGKSQQSEERTALKEEGECERGLLLVLLLCACVGIWGGSGLPPQAGRPWPAAEPHTPTAGVDPNCAPHGSPPLYKTHTHTHTPRLLHVLF